MTEQCDDCVEVKKLGFQLEGLELCLQKQKVNMEGIQQEQVNRDIEHEAMIQGVTTRMDSISIRMDDMSNNFQELRTEVRKDIQSIKEEIPAMFEASINALMARIAKWLLIGILSFAGAVILIITLAITRPMIVSGLEELVKKAQTVEVRK